MCAWGPPAPPLNTASCPSPTSYNHWPRHCYTKNAERTVQQLTLLKRKIGELEWIDPKPLRHIRLYKNLAPFRLPPIIIYITGTHTTVKRFVGLITYFQSSIYCEQFANLMPLLAGCNIYTLEKAGVQYVLGIHRIRHSFSPSFWWIDVKINRKCQIQIKIIPRRHLKFMVLSTSLSASC